MNGMQSMLAFALIAWSAATYAASGPSHVLRCTDADGHVVFSDTSCASSQRVEVVQSSGRPSAVAGHDPSAQAGGTPSAYDAQVAAQPARDGGGSTTSNAAAAAAPSAPPSHGS